MIVICEECGKKYRVDQDKIKGEEARFKCKTCNNMITVKKKVEQPEFESPPETLVMEPEPEMDTGPMAVAPPAPEIPVAKEKLAQGIGRRGTKEVRHSRGLGLRFKMMLLFLVIPLILIVLAGYLYLDQVKSLTDSLIEDSNTAVLRMAENRVADKGRSVAQQCRLYLHANPNLTPENFKFDLDFKRIGVQKVGKTGYTSMYSIAGDGKPVILWLHPDPKLIGLPLGAIMKKALGNDFDSFGRIAAEAENGKNIETSGEYIWMDKDGKKRSKFMVITPIEGTRFGIASSTYLDEFTQDIRTMRQNADSKVARTRQIIFGILIGTIAFIAIIVSVYGHRLTTRIKSLTDVAERISVGELEAEVSSAAGDELGDLAEAILRMQDSIRLSIERLRRRR